MKQIKVELSNEASAVLNKMSRLGKIKPDAIARVALEHTLSQAVDALMAKDGDLWFIANAKDPEETCRHSWADVQQPIGSYASILQASSRVVFGFDE